MRTFLNVPLSLAALAAFTLFAIGCQPAAEGGGGDPDALLDGFEAAIEAMTDAADTHRAAVSDAADADAVLAEEAAFAASGHELFEEVVHHAEELAACTGMEVHEDEVGPADVHDMMVDLDAAFEAHEGEMTAADPADHAVVEAAFNDEVTTHAGHGVDLHDEMHEHAEAGELECAEHEE